MLLAPWLPESLLWGRRIDRSILISFLTWNKYTCALKSLPREFNILGCKACRMLKGDSDTEVKFEDKGNGLALKK